jgi:hypothetical protein
LHAAHQQTRGLDAVERPKHIDGYAHRTDGALGSETVEEPAFNA